MFGLVVSHPMVRLRCVPLRQIFWPGLSVVLMTAMILSPVVSLSPAYVTGENDETLIAKRQIFNPDAFEPGALDDELYNPTKPKPDMQPGDALLDAEKLEQAPLLPAPPAESDLQQTLLDHPLCVVPDNKSVRPNIRCCSDKAIIIPKSP